MSQLNRNIESIYFSKKTICLKPDYALSYNNLVSPLREIGSVQKAIDILKKGIKISPTDSILNRNLGMLLLEQNNFSEAAESFKLCDTEKSQSYLLRCLYNQDKKSLFYELLNTLIKKNVSNPTVGSLACQAAIRYGKITPNLFCKDPISYVVSTDLNVICDFENIFIKPAQAILNENTIQKREQGLLENGTQTAGNLFVSSDNTTQEIKNVIHSELKKYYSLFKSSKENFIQKWPLEYDLYGWLISMRSGGSLKPHMHERGWLSGSIYINVPPKSKWNSGDLVVCIDEEENLHEDTELSKKTVCVATGTLCLFPASLLHYTIPFESTDERIVLAFDMISKGSNF